MGVLIVGLVVFLGSHSVRIFARPWRDRMVARLGEGPWKGLYSLAAAIGFVLIVWGFARASAASPQIYAPPFGLRRITAGLMLIALILALASAFPAGRIKRWVRHPLLIGTIVFAVAHLLANGDLAGILLFGGFLVWAVVDLASQFARPQPVPATGAPSLAGDIGAVVAGIVLYGLIVWRLHYWLIGVMPTV